MAASEVHHSAISVTVQGSSLVLSGSFVGSHPGAWTTQNLDGRRLLIAPESAHTGIATPAGVASLPILLFTNFLVGLNHAKWSGLVTADTGYGLKRLYFSKGELVFAGSNLIDDRLGEVIYREAKISLDELTKSAAQVTKMQKFGQILLASGAMTQIGLWDALGMQVKQILRSIFMVDHVYFEIQEGNSLASSELVLRPLTTDLLHGAASYGSAFRSFLGRLTEDSEARLMVSPDSLSPQYAASTFIGDTLQLIAQFPNVQKLLDASKLMDLYTVATLFHLSNTGIIKIAPEQEDARPRDVSFQGVRAKLDAYSFVLSSVRKAFQDAKIGWPITSLRELVAELNPEGWAMLSVEENGEVSRESVLGLYHQVFDHHERADVIARALESMIQFLLQITGDSLNFSLAMKIRQEYRSVST